MPVPCIYIYMYVCICLTLTVPYFLLAIPKRFVTNIIWSQPLFAGRRKLVEEACCIKNSCVYFPGPNMRSRDICPIGKRSGMSLVDLFAIIALHQIPSSMFSQRQVSSESHSNSSANAFRGVQWSGAWGFSMDPWWSFGTESGGRIGPCRMLSTYVRKALLISSERFASFNPRNNPTLQWVGESLSWICLTEIQTLCAAWFLQGLESSPMISWNLWRRPKTPLQSRRIIRFLPFVVVFVLKSRVPVCWTRVLVARVFHGC